jgi:hypothetical protein
VGPFPFWGGDIVRCIELDFTKKIDKKGKEQIRWGWEKWRGDRRRTNMSCEDFNFAHGRDV